MDAALASAIALTVVEPTGNGLGSDAFAIVWDGSQLHGLNASGCSLASWSTDQFKGRASMPERGWDSVTLPGAVSAWVSLSERFGVLPFETLFEPAIKLGETGFPVSPIIATLWSRGGEVLSQQPGFAEHFLPGGRAPKAGERFLNPDIASSLRAIAESGGKAFYEGTLAERIAAEAERHGGALSLDDLATHTNDWCGTISRNFDDISLHEIPPNGQGIAALMALGILDHTAVREYGPDDPRALHLMWEAMKLAFRDIHAYVADSTSMTPVRSIDLLDDGYLAGRA